MTVLSILNRKKPAKQRKTQRSIGTAAGITTTSLIVAAVVSASVAIGYGVEISKLVDFTNWAVIFTAIEAIAFLIASTLIVKKIQPNKPVPENQQTQL
jgi:sugar phosphate permease